MIKLISKFVTSQPDYQTITIPILPNMVIRIEYNIIQSKDNQTMKFGHLIKYNKRNLFFFFKNHVETGAQRLVPDPFPFFKNALYEVKASSLQLSFNIFLQHSTQHTVNINCIKLSIQRLLNFEFLEKGLGIVAPPHFVYDFSTKMFLSCYILLSDQISLSDCLYFLR